MTWLANRMKLYTVHVKAEQADGGEQPVFVREGFNFWAFLLLFVWTLYHRLWIPTLLIAAFYAGIVMLSSMQLISEEMLTIVQLAFQFIVGFQANDWRRQYLSQRGYVTADVVSGINLLSAEQRYFDRYLATA